ncbi:hypothetical protein RB195_026480 [Necator americanus]
MNLKIFRLRERHPRTEAQRIKWWNLKDREEVFSASVAPPTLPHPTRGVEEMWSPTSSVMRTLDRGEQSGKNDSRQVQYTQGYIVLERAAIRAEDCGA